MKKVSKDIILGTRLISHDFSEFINICQNWNFKKNKRNQPNNLAAFLDLLTNNFL